MSRDMHARERLWRWIRAKGKEFTVPQAIEACEISPTGARRFVAQLAKAGIVGQVEDEVRANGQRVSRYRLSVDPGPAMPGDTRLGGGGDARRNDVLPQAVWDAARIAGRFDWDGLMLVLGQGGCEFTENGVRFYLQQVLVRGGYVRDAGPSGPGRCKSYRMVRDTGPRAPVRRNRGVWDANLDEAVAPRSKEAVDA